VGGDKNYSLLALFYPVFSANLQLTQQPMLMLQWKARVKIFPGKALS
jgi:hypothetical protein